MYRIILPPALSLLLCTAYAVPIDAAKSSVKFVFTQMNVSVEGQFKKFSADIVFDAVKPEASKVSMAVDLLSTDAGSGDANQAVQTKDWFNTAAFSKATFSSAQIKALGNGHFQAQGEFGLKGRKAAMSVPFTVRADTAGQWLEGNFPLSRLAWKIGEGDWADVGVVADAVQVKFKIFVPR